MREAASPSCSTCWAANQKPRRHWTWRRRPVRPRLQALSLDGLRIVRNAPRRSRPLNGCRAGLDKGEGIDAGIL